MRTHLLLVGTKKGLFIFTSSDRKKWKVSGPFHSGKEVNHAVYDPRSGKIYAAANDAWFGSELLFSSNLGKTWKSPRTAPAFTEASGTKLERLWHIEPGEGVLYAGVAPAALFRSEDEGQTWEEITSVREHQTRAQWNPGAGGLCLHSIVLRPTDMFVGISAAGVFRSTDNGKSWTPANQGTRAEFLPGKRPEVGQCVHKLLAAPSDGALYQQNHC